MVLRPDLPLGYRGAKVRSGRVKSELLLCDPGAFCRSCATGLVAKALFRAGCLPWEPERFLTNKTVQSPLAAREACSSSGSALELVYVASGREAEHAAVLTVELGGTLITDSKRGVLDVGCAGGHQASSFKET